MQPFLPRATVCRRGLSWLAAFILAALPVRAEVAPLEAKIKRFDVPAGEAISTLKRAAQQAGMEIVFPAKLVRGVETNAVRGSYTPEMAFDLLTAHTVLRVARDERSGALIVRRQPAEAILPKARTGQAAEEGILRLDTLTVTTTVGTYREATTTAGSKTPMNTQDVAGTVQVLNASFIADKQARSLEDLYPYIVGMTRESTAASGFALRGFSNNFTDTMLNNIQFDGLPGGASRFGSPSTANVDRVEVLKGPSSVINGVMDPGGIINIISKQPSARPAHSVLVTLASFAGQGSALGRDLSLMTTLDTTGPLDGKERWLYRFIASYEDLSGFRQFDFGRNYYLYPSLTYRFNPSTEITLKTELNRQRRHASQDTFLAAPFRLIANVPSDHTLSYTDRSDTEYDRANTFNLALSHRFENRWILKLNIRTVQHGDGRALPESHRLLSASPVEDSAIVQRYRNSINTRRYAYYDLNVRGETGPEIFQHTLLLGLSAGYEAHDFRRLFAVNLPGAISVYHPIHDTRPKPYELGVADITDNQPQDAVSKYYNYGAYVSDQMRIGRHWRASAGLRYEYYDMRYYDAALLKRTAMVVNPGQTNQPRVPVSSLGLVYQPGERASLYASYSQSFKPTPPQSAPLPTPEHPAADILPSEKASQFEVGTKLDLLDRKLEFLLSLYDIKRRGATQVIPLLYDAVTNAYLFRQTSQESQGAELSVNYQPKPYCQMQVGYSFDDAKFTDSADPIVLGARVPNAPRHSANFWGRGNVPGGSLRGFGLGLGLIYTGERPGLLSNIPANSMLIPANFRLDLALYYQWKHGDVGLNVTNVLDKSYIASADNELDVVPGSPRKVTVSARYTF